MFVAPSPRAVLRVCPLFCQFCIAKTGRPHFHCMCPPVVLPESVPLLSPSSIFFFLSITCARQIRRKRLKITFCTRFYCSIPYLALTFSLVSRQCPIIKELRIGLSEQRNTNANKITRLYITPGTDGPLELHLKHIGSNRYLA